MNQTNPQSENLLREILFIVFAQKRLIIDTAILIFIVVLGVAFLAPKKYTGQASLLVKGKRLERNPEIVEQITDRRLPITHEDLNSELQILTSSEVIKQTIIELNKVSNIFPKVIAAQKLQTGADPLQSTALIKATKKVKSSLRVMVVPSSKVLNLTFKWRSATEAKLILEVLVEQYFRYRNTVYKPEKVKSFYDQTVNDYQQQIDAQNARLGEIISKVKARDARKEIETNLNLKKEYSQQLGRLEQSRLLKEAEVDYLDQQLAAVEEQAFSANNIRLFSNMSDVSIRALATTVQENLALFREVSKHFKPQSERARASKDNLKKSYDLLVAEVEGVAEKHRGELSALIKSIMFLKTRNDELSTRNVELANLQIELEQINRDKDLLEQSFANYYKLREETHMSERTQSASLNTQVILLTPVWADQSPVFPNKRILVPFGFIISILVALTVGFIKEYFDDTIKRPDDSLKLLDVPTIISFTDKDPKPQYFMIQWLWYGAKALLSRGKVQANKPVVAGVLLLLLAGVLWQQGGVANWLVSERPELAQKTGSKPKLISQAPVIGDASVAAELKPAVEQVVVEQVAVEQVAVEQVAVEQVVVEQAAVEQVVVEQVAVEQVAVEPELIETLLDSRWMVQVGTFANLTNVKKLAQKLNQQGFATELRQQGSDDKPLVRLLVGPLEESALLTQLEAVNQATKAQGKLVTEVLGEFPAISPSDAVEAAVIASLNRWTQAWMDKDIEAFSQSYVDDYYPIRVGSRQKWLDKLTTRLNKPQWLRLKASDLVFHQDGEQIKLQFWLAYRSALYQDQTLKQLTLSQVGENWLISEESNLLIKQKQHHPIAQGKRKSNEVTKLVSPESLSKQY